MGLAEGLHRRSMNPAQPGASHQPATLRTRPVTTNTAATSTPVARTHTPRSFGTARALQLRAMAVDFPVVEGHPNRLPFEGVLTLIDVASDKAPSGSRGHRVVLTRAAAEAALPSLLGMAVDYKTGWDGHDARQKCGIITSAQIDGKQLTVAGFLFARDFPELEQKVQVEGVMGMSYELADAHVADMRASVWMLTRATFTGAAILLRDKAAYRNTSFRLKRANHHR
ncbi:hypothetical protein [Granulicella arctica]|uniref:hypothetical protein n=1 Tax=Granulicella arctica TaxID=940613 RepID=UPI0021E0651B|nr:hypothetical protein [Granulicella arctica]